MSYLIPEPAQNDKTWLFLSKNIYSKIAFKLAYACCFSLRGNLDFPDFRFTPKKFYNIDSMRDPFSRGHLQSEKEYLQEDNFFDQA